MKQISIRKCLNNLLEAIFYLPRTLQAARSGRQNDRFAVLCCLCVKISNVKAHFSLCFGAMSEAGVFHRSNVLKALCDTLREYFLIQRFSQMKENAIYFNWCKQQDTSPAENPSGH